MKGPLIWLDMDQAELDAAYDQSAYAPNREQILARNATNSEGVRARLGVPRRYAYGPTPVEGLDLFATRAPNAPVHVFIHGGAWRTGFAKDYAAAAEMFVGSGAHLAGVVLTTDWVRDFNLPSDTLKGGLCGSGMFDLKPVRLSARSRYVNFTDEMEHALSPQRHLDKLNAPVIVAHGTFETPEFQRQARDFGKISFFQEREKLGVFVFADFLIA